MPRLDLWRSGAIALLASLTSLAAQAQPVAPQKTIANLDLAKLFATRSPWRLVVTQGPPTTDYGDNPAPGALSLCLRKGPTGVCRQLAFLSPKSSVTAPDWEPHYLDMAKPVYPRGPDAPPLLLVVTSSLHAGDGGQLVATQLYRYDLRGDAFTRAYAKAVGTNNNDEVRFIVMGPLRGDVVSAEPTDNAPYGYWIEVDRFTPGGAYSPALRYRSATHYGDGNRLKVIDSETPNIFKHLGLWRAGQPIPLPAGAACAHPRLKQLELWCG